MKHLISSLLLLCLVAQHALALTQDAEGRYLIATGDELNEFAALVNNGQTSIDALLTADIDMAGLSYTPIGHSSGTCYSGTFDGAGHTIDRLVMPNPTSQDGMGIFGYVDAACILNLIAGTNNRIYGKAFVGGIVGDKVNAGTCRLVGCGNQGNVTGTAQNVAALVGCVHNGNLVIENCYNTGRVSGGRESAVFCGWMGGSSSSITNCYNSGTLTSGVEGSNYLYRASPAVRNIYDSSARQGSTRFSTTQRSGGGLCWMLNAANPDGPFRQNLNLGERDNFPTTSTVGHHKVYASGALKCDGSPKTGTSATYSNTDDATYDDHQFLDGLCAVCQLVDEDYLYADRQGYYEIATPQALRWIARYVNASPAHADVCILLTADIDMKGVAYEGIGSLDVAFVGEIDGGRHTISHLTMSRPNDTGVGFVNVAGHEAYVHDLVLDATCSIKGYRYVGGIVGKVDGPKGGEAYFERLGFEGSVSVHDNGGGIVGCIPNNDFTGYFTACYVTGRVDGTSDNAILSGWSSHARFANCYATVSGKGWETGADVVRGFAPPLHQLLCLLRPAEGRGAGELHARRHEEWQAPWFAARRELSTGRGPGRAPHLPA